MARSPAHVALCSLSLLLLLPAAWSAMFTMTNNCGYTVWPGLLSGAGTAPLPPTGFALAHGALATVDAPPSWSGRMWARTLCATDAATGRFACATGDCGSGALQCNGGGAAPPATLAEFTLNGAGELDSFDVSLVDGYNIPILIVPQQGYRCNGSRSSNGSGDAAKCMATGCLVDLNSACPADLRVMAAAGTTGGAGAPVACRGACEAFGTPQYCCSGAYGSPSTCRPSTYSQFFKNACPRAYSYAYDDATSSFTCAAGTSYTITFCPSTTRSSMHATARPPATSALEEMVPAAPVAVEVVQLQLRKLLGLQASGMRLGGRRQVSVGLLTTVVLITIFCIAGAVAIFILGWPLFRRPKAVNFLDINEEEVISNLHDRNFIGHTEMGEGLYRVHLQTRSGGTGTVMVKKLENETGAVDAGIESRYQSEANKLGVIRHDNIINLVHCIRRDNMTLILYEDVEKGSLDEWLPRQPTEAGERRRRPQLNWRARRAIAVGAARGLCHLHRGCSNPIVHSNINPGNIFLDANLNVKIAGFELAEEVNLDGLNNQPFTSSRLPDYSLGYTAPEYGTGEMNEKVDVYSFGVLLLELVTGRPANRPGVAGGHLATWARSLLLENHGALLESAVDADMPHRAWHLKEMAAVFRLGVDCTAKEPWNRPSMQTVLSRLRSSGRLWGLGQCFL